MPTGYCTIGDVRRALQSTVREFEDGAWGDDNKQSVVDAITAQTEWFEKRLKRHFYVPDGIGEDSKGIIPKEPKTRDDEEDIPTGGAYVAGTPVTPKTWQGSYTRIRLARRYATSIDQLLVRTPDGYEDWVASNEYDGGAWPDAVGDDYYVRVNNGGVTQLYLDSENFLNKDGEPLLDSFSNAVYVTFAHGHEGLPQTIRRAVAMRAGSELLIDDEASLGIPENSQLVTVETKKQAMESKSEELLEEYLD